MQTAAEFAGLFRVVGNVPLYLHDMVAQQVPNVKGRSTLWKHHNAFGILSGPTPTPFTARVYVRAVHEQVEAVVVCPGNLYCFDCGTQFYCMPAGPYQRKMTSSVYGMWGVCFLFRLMSKRTGRTVNARAHLGVS